MTSLLLMPGMDGTGDLFDPLIAVSRRAARRVRFPPDVALSTDALVDHAARSIPAGPWAIVAESWSGPTAVRLAARRPEGLVALALVCSFILPPLPVPAGPAAALAALAPRLPTPEWALRLLLIGDAPADRVAALRASIRSVSSGVMASRARQISTVDARDDLRRVAAPVLYLRATADRLVPRAACEQVRAVRPDARVVELDGPHLLLQRAPEAAMAAIDALLAGLDAPA